MQLNISSISLNICWTIQNGFFSYFIHILKIRYQHVYNDYFAYFYCEGMIWKTLGHLHQAHNKWKSSNEFCTVIDLTLNFLTKICDAFELQVELQIESETHTGSLRGRRWRRRASSRSATGRRHASPDQASSSFNIFRSPHLSLFFLEFELNKEFVIVI